MVKYSKELKSKVLAGDGNWWSLIIKSVGGSGMSRRKVVGGGCMVLFLFILLGCATVPTSYKAKEPVGEIPLSSLLRFNDIPVPETFNFDFKNSYIFENKFTRVGILRYSTRSSPEEIVAFFKTQMPSAGWSLVNIVEYGQKILSYSKEGESCVITVLPGRATSMVIISVTPQYGGSYPVRGEE